METSSSDTQIIATEKEHSTLVEIKRALSTTHSLQLLAENGTQILLPESILTLLRQSVTPLEKGQAITIILAEQELTTQAAADILNISRPSLIKLLENQVIPYTKVGKHRRIRSDDVLAYKMRRHQEREEALNRLTELSQEYELYDET